MKKYQINNFKERLYYEELKNGLKVFVIPIKNKQNFSAMIVTKYGGQDINFKVNNQTYKMPTGIAHFLEHKMFEREEDPFKFYGKYGADVNAATSDEYTGYYFTGNKCFNKCLKYLLNWVQDLKINNEQVEKEKGIILEEASMYKDNPPRVMYNKLKENIYINNPRKNKVIGTDEDIVRITKKELELCYETFYVPNNMYLIVAGKVEPQNVIDIAKKQTKNFRPNIQKVERMYEQEPDKVRKKYEEIKMNVGTPKVSVSYKINKNCFSNLKITPFELDLYLHIIINMSLGITSEIRQQWLEKNLFTSTFYRISEIKSHYVIELHADSTNLDILIENLKKYIKDLKLDKASFEREKKIWIAGEIRSIENPMTMIYNVLDDMLDYDVFINNKIDYIKNLNFETLTKVKKCLNFDNMSIIKILPLEK